MLTLQLIHILLFLFLILNKYLAKIILTYEFNQLLEEFENDQLEFSHPVYKLMFAEFQKIWQNPDFDCQAYFINHANPDISRIAVDIIRPAHELSKIHSKQGAYIRTEASMLKKVVPETLISFRSRMGKQLISDIDLDIKMCQKSGDMENILTLLEKRKHLDQLRKQLSKDLKRII